MKHDRCNNLRSDNASFFGLLKFKNAIFKILCSTAQHAGIAVHNHPPGGRHISTEIWQRLSSLFPFSRAFSAFPFFPPFPFFRLSLFSAFPSFSRFFKKQKPLRRRECMDYIVECLHNPFYDVLQKFSGSSIMNFC